MKYVQQLRAGNANQNGALGAVRIAHPDALESTLKDAWLVVEVRARPVSRRTMFLTFYLHSVYLKPWN